MHVVKILLLFAPALAIALAVPPHITTAPYAVPLDERDLHDFYNTLTFDVVSFYNNFITSRYSYLNNYKTFFLTHTFSVPGQGDNGDAYNQQSLASVSSRFSQLVTYTDDSFTTLFASDTVLKADFSSMATQFPWFSDWLKNNDGATAQSTASVNAAAPGLLSKHPVGPSSMNFMSYMVLCLSVTLCLAVF